MKQAFVAQGFLFTSIGIEAGGGAQPRLLLQNVCEFVSQQGLSAAARRIVAARAEDNVVTNGIRESIHGTGRLSSRVAGMNADGTQILGKARFEEIADGLLDGLAGRTQDLMNYWRGRSKGGGG